MKLIVGLGNPGPQYAKTRHNVGFMVVDRLASAHAPREVPRSRFNAACVEAGIRGTRCVLVKPTTFMNRSGQCVAEAVRFYKVEPVSDLLVIVDDLYLPLGSLRIRAEGSAGGHNGLADIERLLGSAAYPRLRIGVGSGAAGGKPPLMDQADFVLSRFTEDEWAALDPALARSTQAAETFITDGLSTAMNRFNGKGGSDRPSAPRPSPVDQPRPAGSLTAAPSPAAARSAPPQIPQPSNVSELENPDARKA